MKTNNKTEIFEYMSIPRALATMAIPTIVSQLIALVYNIADTWFIGQTDNPYMVGAAALSATVFLMSTGLANLFGVGGGTLVVRLLGGHNETEAEKVASWSLVMAFFSSLAFSFACWIFMDPLLYVLGASENTIGYARQYLFFVVVLGAVPTVLSQTMSSMLRNIGYSKEAAFGLSMGGLLNVILDPLFMFVLMPDGYEVIGAASATLVSNVVSFVCYVLMYQRVKGHTILAIPKCLEKISQTSFQSIFSVGIPAACSLLFYDFCNMVINMLTASHGDLQLAAMGIVLKVERLPLNIGIGICLGMVPIIGYNYASKNEKRMKDCFAAARFSGVAISLVCVVLYRLFAPQIMQAFISDGATVEFGTAFLQARCFATPLMFLSFHMVHFMQAINRGKVSFYLAAIRQLCLNIPLLFILNALLGMSGIIWTQVIADFMNVIASYLIYVRVMKTKPQVS
ncbi:MAG: polysaccharide biosynthesis C-terminal domain-containing protein [Lachnospiraceae bacterium]|nr:polysaccharide biosynthesis C-terminal domain-containing protein [Lachnospiraceae bacterium]